MKRKTHPPGFTLAELLIVVSVLGTIAAIAIPSATRDLADYRLHSDASSLSSWLNVARMKAASQFAPYRLNVNLSSGSYVLEQLCGGNTSDTACTATGATPYTAYSSPFYDNSGTQYLSTGDTTSSCRPSGISTFPGSITADPSTCPNPLRVYFNTRGVPVDSSGNPLTNGGAAIYLKNPDNLVDAVVVSLGGQVSVWNYSPGSGTWYMR
jgi:prepilin-type N-terminal cleavage/methylation domain-containing protein